MEILKINLEHKSMKLRPFYKDDIEDLYNITSIPGVGEMAGWPHHTSLEESIILSSRMLKDKNTLSILWDDQMIGYIQITQVDDQLREIFNEFLNIGKARVISYVLHPSYWNKGIMTKAIGMLAGCLKNSALNTLVSGHYIENIGSGQVLIKNNFEPIFEVEGTLWDGSVKDAIMYIKILN